MVVDFDASAYAARLEETVLPGILNGLTGDVAVRPRAADRLQAVSFIQKELAASGPESQARALLEAAAPFAPPDDLQGGADTHALLLGMIAFRAATTDFIQRYPDLRVRYRHAASWVCENLRDIFWWTCDRR